MTRPLQNLAWIHAQASRISEADRYTARLLDIAARSYASDHPRIGSILATVASVHDAAGPFVDAANAYERAFGLLDPDDQCPTPDRHNLAAMYTTLGDLTAAARHAEAALRQVEERLDSRHPKRLGSRRALARVEGRAGRVDAALARMDRARRDRAPRGRRP